MIDGSVKNEKEFKGVVLYGNQKDGYEIAGEFVGGNLLSFCEKLKLAKVDNFARKKGFKDLEHMISYYDTLAMDKKCYAKSFIIFN